ncbi:hypothetical protein ACSBR2_027306 [Camellia fascicularis]
MNNCVATEDFKERLGGGAFGFVFKGMLEDATQIMAKRLDKLDQGMKEFFAEVETLGHIYHVNLVREESHVLTTMRGTLGYIAPEWWQARVTIKTDIYSFGIVLLEIVSGWQNFDSTQSESRKHLLQVLWKKAEYQLIDIVENMDEGVKQYHAERWSG